MVFWIFSRASLALASAGDAIVFLALDLRAAGFLAAALRGAFFAAGRFLAGDFFAAARLAGAFLRDAAFFFAAGFFLAVAITLFSTVIKGLTQFKNSNKILVKQQPVAKKNTEKAALFALRNV
jgi:hypothetical protein